MVPSNVVVSPMRTPEEWAWFNEHNHVFWVEDTIGMVARRKGKLVAGAVIDNRINHSAQIHLLVQDPIVFRHGFWEALFNAAFGDKRQYVFANVSGNNLKVRKLAKHIGFTELLTIKDGMDVGEDMVMIQLRREDCKYLGE